MEQTINVELDSEGVIRKESMHKAGMKFADEYQQNIWMKSWLESDQNISKDHAYLFLSRAYSDISSADTKAHLKSTAIMLKSLQSSLDKVKEELTTQKHDLHAFSISIGLSMTRYFNHLSFKHETLIKNQQSFEDSMTK